MTNYLLLFSGGKMPESEAEQKSELARWETWYTKLGGAVVDPGNPFTPMAKSIASDGKVGEVPAASMASGYTILKADSLDAAVLMAKGCPVLYSGGRLSVFETFNIM